MLCRCRILRQRDVARVADKESYIDDEPAAAICRLSHGQYKDSVVIRTPRAQGSRALGLNQVGELCAHEQESGAVEVSQTQRTQ